MSQSQPRRRKPLEIAATGSMRAQIAMPVDDARAQEAELMIGVRVEPDLLRRCDRWEGWLADLIRMPSPRGSERAVVEYVVARLRELGHEPSFVEHADGRRNVVSRMRGTGEGRSLILNAHLDVVPVGDENAWTHGPFSGYIDRDKRLIFGRGALDDKAGVVILLAIAELFRDRRPAGDVIFQFVVDDETGGEGSRLCLDAGWRGDAALIVDGTRLDRAICRHAGQVQFSVHVAGKPASISVAHTGVNAAEMLARLVLELRDAIAARNAGLEPPWTRFPSPFQLVVQRLHSEGETLTVPDRAEAVAYVTFTPPDTLASIRALLQHCVDGFKRRAGDGLGVTLAWDGFCAEAVESQDPELVSTLQASAAALDMGPIDVGPSTGTSDMRHFVARSIPCLLYGPGGGSNPHRADENFALDDLPRMVALYSAFVARWCGG